MSKGLVFKNRLLYIIGVSLLAGVVFAVFRLPKAETGAASAADLQQIVEQFYPQRLVDLAEPEGPGNVPLSRKFSASVLDSFSDGAARTIVACYSNGVEGAIRVIQANTAGTFSVILEPENLDLGGIDCNAGLVDLDSDGGDEIHVQFVTFQGGTVHWVFRWDGTQLVSIGPTEPEADGLETARLRNAWFVDLDHDGILDAVSVDGDFRPLAGQPTAAYTVYRLSDGKYVLDKPILYISAFVRHKGSPEISTQEFVLVQNSQGPYVLRLMNGEKDGTRRVSSARILLNGAEVLSPQNFSQQVEFLSLPVTLLLRNTIEVTLAGEPLGEIIITIEDTSAQPTPNP